MHTRQQVFQYILLYITFNASKLLCIQYKLVYTILFLCHKNENKNLCIHYKLMYNVHDIIFRRAPSGPQKKGNDLDAPRPLVAFSAVDRKRKGMIPKP